LWRAVDADGLVLGALVQGREDRRAVEKLAVNELLRQLIRTPCVMVTDKPGSDGAAQTGMDLNVEHRQHKSLNNRTKNAHLPTLRRKRIMKRIMKRIIKRFTSVRHLKRLVFIHDPIANLQTVPATPRRHLAIERFVPGQWSCGARSPNRASPRSARR
jgi:putative transposase